MPSAIQRVSLLISAVAVGITGWAVVMRPAPTPEPQSTSPALPAAGAPKASARPGESAARPTPGGAPSEPAKRPLWSTRNLDESAEALAVQMGLSRDDLRLVVDKEGKVPLNLTTRLLSAESSARALATRLLLGPKETADLVSIFGHFVLRPYTFTAEASTRGARPSGRLAEAAARKEALGSIRATPGLGPEASDAAEPLLSALLE